MSDFLHVFNAQGRDVDVPPGQWVVRIGDDFSVLDDDMFADLFEPTEADF
jgi:hypothetical protein